MATSTRLARRPEARQAAPKAAPDRFEAFVTTLENELRQRLDAQPTAKSAVCEALFDVLMAVSHAAKAARDADNQNEGRKS